VPRRLSADERALWAKVVASVRPLNEPAETPQEPEPAPRPEAAAAPKPAAPRPRPARPPLPAKRQPGNTLDGTWDRRLSRGLVSPELSVDLHGHDLATAYDLLDRRLDDAISSGARLLLLITGKPPKGEPPHARGRIRAAVGDWLAASRHSGDIAAVRAAHPRHGGAGALYIVLRRRRDADTKS
jgi:DNA-nicking Smr family endonuclease